ncbi:MAG: hypothetical protein AAF092_05255 [Pseudomonadota bacterium]
MTVTLYDVAKIHGALLLLEDCDPDIRLINLESLCINNDGTWCVPPRAEDYAPVLYEIQLFGVSAVSPDPAQLPVNWMRAAQAVLDGCRARSEAPATMVGGELSHAL